MASAWAVPPAASLGSLSQSALQLFCGSHRAGDQAQATLWAVRARPDPACSEQPCAPLSRPHHPTRDAHGLQCLQGSGCAGGWVPSPACTSSTGIRDGGLGLPKPHTGPRTGVPCTHLGAVGTRSLPPLFLEGRLGPRAGQGSASGLQATLWWGLPAARPARFSCSGLGLGPGHHVHSPTQLFIHQPTHLFIRSFTHSPDHSFIHSLTCSFIHPLSCSFIHSLTCSFIHSFTHSPVHSFAHSLIYSPTHSFIPSHTHSLTPSLPLSVAHGHLPGAGPPWRWTPDRRALEGWGTCVGRSRHRLDL